MEPNIRGQYQLLEKLGSGGMGEVYKARDSKLNRMVAVKVLHPEQTRDKDLRRRFIQEAQAASALNHPNIITIHDIVSDEGSDLIVMEYVAGRTLGEVIPKGGLRAPQVIGYAVQMADALAAAHAAGIIHRDLKPGNVMVTENGLVKILDFGLAKMVEQDTTDPDATLVSPLTVEGSIIGTVAYMSPEQAQGQKVDRRTDIFSFGAMLYEMATGQRAFGGSNNVTTLSMLLMEDVKPIPQIAPDVPMELDSLILRCLRKNPTDRYQSMREVHQSLTALKQVSDSGTLYRSAIMPPSAPPSTSLPQAAPSKKTPVGLIAGLAALIAVLGAGGYWLATRKASTPPPPVVQTSTPLSQPAPAEPETTLNNDSILAMVKARLSPSLIANQIKSSKTNFDLSNSEVIRLVQAGVPEPLIEVMRDPSKPLSVKLQPTPPAVPAPGGPDANAIATSVPPAKPLAPPVEPPSPTKTVLLPDGLAIQLLLADDVATDAAEGDPLRFTVAQDVRINGTVAIGAGAQAAGVIHEAGGKRKLLTKGAKTYRLLYATSVDGKQVRLRATPSAPKDGDVARRPVIAGKDKEIASPKGTSYPAYVDGDAPVAGK